MTGHRRGLDVVVVSWRCAPLLRRCLESLRDLPTLPLHVVVVDNASRDGTVEMVGAEFPEVELVEAPRNLGFAAATNIGIRRTGSAYVLALNPDTEVTGAALDVLVAILDKRPEVAVVGPKLVRPDGSFDHASRRSFPTPLGALGHFTRIGRTRWAPKALSQYRAPHVEGGPVDAVNGAFMLMRRTALDQVGLFDEGYWMYMEDLDLSYRLKEAGWVTWYEPEVTVTHIKHGASGQRRSSNLVYHFHYGMFRFYRRHYARGRARSVLDLLAYAGIGGKLVVALIRSSFRSTETR
jgi:N-acetylglucosaminyl-diphospho-decaprenol L-rhamnosyltransferase